MRAVRAGARVVGGGRRARKMWRAVAGGKTSKAASQSALRTAGKWCGGGNRHDNIGSARISTISY